MPQKVILVVVLLIEGKRVSFVELWTQLLFRVLSYTLLRLLYPAGDKSKRTTDGPVKIFVTVGLNLLKESEIFAPQPEEILFLIHFQL